MTFSIHGLAVSRGIAIGRAVLVASSHVDVAHYFIQPDRVAHELARVRDAKDAVVTELIKLQHGLSGKDAKDTPTELTAILDVHQMLLQDQSLQDGVAHWIKDRLYNAEWALTTQLEIVSRQFDEMQDAYLRERKADLEQVVERILRVLKGAPSPLAASVKSVARPAQQADLLADIDADTPLILIAHDLSPADMLQFKSSVFAGFVTDVGGKTSHTAIVARSLDIPAVVGARTASQLVRQDDWVIIDGDAGIMVVDPTPIILEEYSFKQRQEQLARAKLSRLRHTPTITLDGVKIQLLANIELPDDAAAALTSGAVGVGLFRSEFLFMGKHGKLPDEEEQYQAYRRAVEGMQGLPVTIRTVDIGADKPLDDHSTREQSQLSSALGLRAIRWSLSEPVMFRTQIRAILRAAAHGQVNMMIPMLCSVSEIKQTIHQVDIARAELDNRGAVYGGIKLGAMIEIPAAALSLKTFLKYFDFLSLGTNDLIQYTLAIDRADASVAHLYDPLHPAVLQLIAHTIAACDAAGKDVSICGEMAGDPAMTRLLLGMGLRVFSMHPSQLLTVKQEILRADTGQLAVLAQRALDSEDPGTQ